MRNTQPRIIEGMPRPQKKSEPTPLGERLRKARSKRGMTQGDLATRAGLKQADISKLEKGLMRSTTKGYGLARALQVPMGWLELGEGPEPQWSSTDPAPASRRDQNTISDSQLELLMAIELVIPPEEQQRLLVEAERLRRVSEAQLKSAGQFTGSASGTMTPSPRSAQRKEGGR
jgi:transcriptional regulator with XRE-family HTH domain